MGRSSLRPAPLPSRFANSHNSTVVCAVVMIKWENNAPLGADAHDLQCWRRRPCNSRRVVGGGGHGDRGNHHLHRLRDDQQVTTAESGRLCLRCRIDGCLRSVRSLCITRKRQHCTPLQNHRSPVRSRSRLGRSKRCSRLSWNGNRRRGQMKKHLRHRQHDPRPSLARGGIRRPAPPP